MPVANYATRSQIRSARHHLVIFPRYNRSTYGCHAFCVACPVTWNSFTDSLCDLSLSTDSVRRQLKTFLFSHQALCIQRIRDFLPMCYIMVRFTLLEPPNNRILSEPLSHPTTDFFQSHPLFMRKTV